MEVIRIWQKNRKNVLHEARKVLYGVVDEIEISNSIQIAQNNEKIEALAADIVATTKSSSYAEFLSELYYKATLMKDTIISELTAASKNNCFSHSGYVLSINA